MIGTRTDPTPTLHTFFPKIEPYAQGFLKVSALHELYYEVSGNPNGIPVVFVHGGPGGGVSPTHRRFFDPAAYRIVLFDQRGAGKSKPHACLEDNTTQHLVADMEQLRQHLDIEQWLVFGGSWGSTLALAYALDHREAVSGLILRGIFMGRPWEIEWLYQQGASRVFPDAYAPYRDFIPVEEQHELVNAYYRRLTGEDKALQIEAAKHWSVWEASISKLIPDTDIVEEFEDPHFALAFARIEAHFFYHKTFFDSDNELLDRARDQQTAFASLPTWIVHGRYDMVCAAQNAWELAEAWPHAELTLVPDAGHGSTEPGTLHTLIAATESFKQAFA